MRLLTFSLLALGVAAAAPAWAQGAGQSGGAAHAGAARNTLSNGVTKPPGHVAPGTGIDRMEAIERKSDRIGRAMERSVCKC